MAHSLLASLHADDQTPTETDTEVDASWSVEIRRRVEEIENGTVRLVSGEESQAQARDLLAELHQ